MRRRLLLFIVFALMLPSFAVLLVSGLGILQHEWAIRYVARSYVQRFENTASVVLPTSPRLGARDEHDGNTRPQAVFVGPSASAG